MCAILSNAVTSPSLQGHGARTQPGSQTLSVKHYHIIYFNSGLALNIQVWVNLTSVFFLEQRRTQPGSQTLSDYLFQFRIGFRYLSMNQSDLSFYFLEQWSHHNCKTTEREPNPLHKHYQIIYFNSELALKYDSILNMSQSVWVHFLMRVNVHFFLSSGVTITARPRSENSTGFKKIPDNIF